MKDVRVIEGSVQAEEECVCVEQHCFAVERREEEGEGDNVSRTLHFSHMEAHRVERCACVATPHDKVNEATTIH